MSEQFDEYSDAFLTTIGAWGVALTFRRSPAISAPAGTPVQQDDVGVIRMSLEHMKAMSYILRNQILEYEQRNGVNIQIPMTALNAMNIAPEDWEKFWQPSEQQ